MFMRFYFGKQAGEFFKDCLSFELFFGVGSLRFVGGDFGCRFVAFAARRHKNNRGQKIVVSERGDKFRRRNVGSLLIQF